MKRKTFNLILIIILLIFIGLSGFLFYKLKRVENSNNTDTKEEVQNLIDKVSRLYLVPQGEEPTIATVSDPEILKEQSFFTLAEKGDKVLIFSRASKAVLYRPSVDKIIEIAPIKNNPLSSIKQDVENSQEKDN